MAVLLPIGLCLIGGVDAAATLPIFFSFGLGLLGVIVVCRTRLLPVGGEGSKENDIRLDAVCLSFALLGALTAYFDFLDNPLYSLCLPLIFLVLRMSDYRGPEAILAGFFFAIFFWAFGYVCFWGMKWVLGSLFIGQDVIGKALQAIGYRTSSTLGDGSATSFFDVLVSNAYFLGFAVWIMVFVVILSWVVLLLQGVECKRDKGNSERCRQLLVNALLMIISLAPFIWYALLGNHSRIHAQIISFRTLGITLVASFASIAYIVSLLRKGKSKNQREDGV